LLELTFRVSMRLIVPFPIPIFPYLCFEGWDGL
jgi:hypothetical protein